MNMISRVTLCFVIICCTLLSECKASLYHNASSARLNLDTLLSNPESDGINRVISSKLLSSWPWFLPHHDVSEACWNESIQYIMDLQTIRLHALKMWDASAKISSGILNGNVNQYGDYDLCLEGGGRYCLAYLQLDLTRTDLPDLVNIHSMIHSYHAFRSTLEDPGHRVPRYSTIHWGLCVPRSCGPRDVEITLKSVLSSVSSNTGLILKAKIFPEMCPAVSSQSISTSTAIAGSVFALLLLLVAVTTIQDFFEEKGNNETKSSWLKVVEGFSLKRNVSKLLDVKESSDDISSVHGIRFFNAIMLYLSHKSLSVFYNPFVNRTHMSLMLGAGWTVVTRAASLYTDPFIMISGLLTSYCLLKNTAPLKFHKEIISRLFRLLPSLAALIAFCTFILPNLGSGPQWPLVIESHAKICKKYWWRNLLLIHNYFGFKNMCLTHTHHVGIDTQLFMVSLIVVPILRKWPRRCLHLLMSVAVVSTVLRFYTAYYKELNLYIHFGNPVKRMFDTADYSYILPTHRATVYIMGIVLGYILRHTGRKYHLKKSQWGVGWTAAFCCLYMSLVPWSKMGDIDYKYNSLDAANYSAFAPITWCLFFSWVIFTSHTGNSFGFITKMFENKLFLISTRLSYSFYLTQFPVFFYNVGRVRSNTYFNFFVMTDVLELASVAIMTVLLTLLVEMPFQNIRSIIFDKNREKNKSTSASIKKIYSENSQIKQEVNGIMKTEFVNDKLVKTAQNGLSNGIHKLHNDAVKPVLNNDLYNHATIESNIQYEFNQNINNENSNKKTK